MASNRRHGSDKADYVVAHLVTHLAESGRYNRLFELLETKDFLARQAEALSGFRQGSLDLESQVLPAAIEQRDWPRFLRHAVVGIGLRGLAEDLADEDIVRALVKHGQAALATDIVEQLTDPQTRIRARGALLGALSRMAKGRAGDGGAHGIARIIEEIDAEPSPEDPPAARSWLATLRTVARHLGPELRGHWNGWIGRLRGVTPELADDAWLAVAESWLERDLVPGSGLWPALAEVPPGRVLQFLPRRLAASPRRSARFLDGPLPLPFADREELVFDVRVALLAAAAAEDPWPRVRDLPIDSVERVELGRELWPRLGPEQRDSLAAGIDDVTVRAAFRIVVLEGLRETAGREVPSGDETAALEALSALPPSARLHWTLRCLAQLSPSRSRRQYVRTVAHHLYAWRYDVPDGDLARFVDLIAKVLPGDLPRVLPNLVAAPSSGAETLRSLARRCQRMEVLEELRGNVERYAVAATDNDGEGFQLRAEVLSRIAGRLCVRREELQPYREALERLLPEEEDPLRLAVIDELAAGSNTCRQLAMEVCQELRSKRLALRSRLRLSAAGEELDDVLSPAALYEAVAGSDAVADELAALAPLLERPAAAEGRRAPQELGGLFLDVHDSDRRILAMLDLARHDLAFQRQELRPGQLDPVAALQPLSRVVGGVTTDRRLVALMPELVEMGSQVSPSRALAELQESVLRLLRLEEVGWPLRAESLETILGYLGPWVSAAEGAQASSRRRAALTFLRWIARLPAQADLPEELSEHWPELLPIVLAAAECLPASCRHRLRRPWSASLEKLMTRLPGWQRGPWTGGQEGFAGWASGAPEVLAASVAGAEELASLLAERLDPRAPSRIAQALLCLLAVRDAERTTPLLGRLAPAERQAMALRLVRHGWLKDYPSPSFLKLDDPASHRLRLVRELRRESDVRDTAAVARGVATALALGELDPLDGRSALVRRALWTTGTESCRATLGRAAVGALAAAGRTGGERALCFWVHSWVRPRPGEEAPVERERRSALTAALRQAETIPGPLHGSP